MGARFFATFISAVIFFLILELVRRQKMTFKYSVAWLAGSILVTGFALKPKALEWLARAAGFELASNFIFFSLLAFFVLLSLFLTIYVDEQNRRTEALAQAVAVLDYKIQKLQK